jgi:hypothetical protein
MTMIARREGTKVETIRRYFPNALKSIGGRLQVTKRDRYTYTLYLPNAEGQSVAIKTRSSRERTKAGSYLRDVGRALRGRRGVLSKWKGKKIAGVELVTDLNVLTSIESVLSDFALYRHLNSVV